jgi:hypothetical protein
MDASKFTLARFLEINWDYDLNLETHYGYFSVSRELEEWAKNKTEKGDADQAAMLALIARAASMMMTPKFLERPL